MAVDLPDVRNIKDELAKDNRDIVELWQEAMRKYKGIVGTELQPHGSVQEMIDFGTKEMESFQSFRHNRKKVDRLRGLLMANMCYIEKGAQQLIAAATPVFPPAAAIGTALTYMLTACKQVSADYDVVAAFFEDMNSYLQRITILESRLPSYPAYKNCLMDVFSSVLEMCGYATKYIELGRFKKWIINKVQGEDSDLGGARKKMDTSLTRLQSATEYAILGNTEEIQRMNADLQQNQDLQTQMMEEQTKMLNIIFEGQEAVRNEMKNMQKLLVMFQTQRREELSAKKTLTSAGQKKPATAQRVRSFFVTMVDPMVEYYNIQDTLVADTCKWLFDKPEWSAWRNNEMNQRTPRVLTVEGPSGAGKSHLAVSAYDQLVKTADTNTCVSHFYFRDNRSWNFSTFGNAVYWLLIQIAEQHVDLCEKINVSLQREEEEFDDWEAKDYWEKVVLPLFPSGGSTQLLIVWDGLDELRLSENEELLKFLASLKAQDQTNIALLCTTRPGAPIHGVLEDSESRFIVVDKTLQETDMQTLIWSHLNNRGGLKRLSKYAKQRIVDAVIEKSDGMLYAEHVLRQFNDISREPLILKQLDHLPENWEALYEDMLADLELYTSNTNQKPIRTLLAWIAFSRRALNIDECLALLKLSGYSDFDLERELQGRPLSNFLLLSAAEETDDEEEDEKEQESYLGLLRPPQREEIPNDDHLPLRFRDRSMRDFCRSGNTIGGDLRTPAAQAHSEILSLCSRIISGELKDVHKGLAKYAGSAWMYHLSWVNAGTRATAIRLGAAEAVAAIMTSKISAANRIETSGCDYDTLGEDFTTEDAINSHIQISADVIAKSSPESTSEVAVWAQSVIEDKEYAFMRLAKAHVANWLQAEDVDSVNRSYKFARSCLKLTKLKHIVTKNSDDNISSDGDDSDDAYKKEEIIAISKAFADMPLDGNAPWSVAVLLTSSGYPLEAREHAREAVAQLTGRPKQVQALDLLVNICCGLHEKKKRAIDIEEARERISEALSITVNAEPRLRRKVLLTAGRVHKAMGNVKQAATYYQQARTMVPDEPMPGDHLLAESQMYFSSKLDAELVTLVSQWQSTEKLTWMTWKFEEDTGVHQNFTRAAGRTCQQDVMVGVYNEVVSLLDSLDSAAPIRFHLARAQWLICGDVKAAKALMSETLDAASNNDLHKFTSEEPTWSLVCAAVLMAQLIYEQYRATSGRVLKAQLFDEINGLLRRPLAQSVTLARSDLLYIDLVTAKMTRKMGTAVQFQDKLQTAFDTCFEALIDNVGWNDWLNLINMAVIISQLEGMERDAQILVSAQFSQLQPESDQAADERTHDEVASNSDASTKQEDDDEKTGDSDTESSENESSVVSGAPSEEGDLVDARIYCDGECEPTVEWNCWKGRKMFVCMTCDALNLCAECHEKRQAYNTGRVGCPVPGPYFCGKDHKYIEGPISGWGGIRNGIMTIDGIEVEWRMWLEELRNDRWMKAWDRFWTTDE